MLDLHCNGTANLEDAMKMLDAPSLQCVLSKLGHRGKILRGLRIPAQIVQSVLLDVLTLASAGSQGHVWPQNTIVAPISHYPNIGPLVGPMRRNCEAQNFEAYIGAIMG